jgi:hypothetical protein
MSLNGITTDLIVLTADKNMRFAVEGLISRPQALFIRPVKANFYIHPERDPGCLLRSHSFLGSFVNQYTHAIVMFDREGCGREHQSRDELENEVTSCLSGSGWGDRATAIVIDPELENWVFSDSSEIDAVIGWVNKKQSLKTWLQENNLWSTGKLKPERPKEAFEKALRHIRLARSSAIYKQLAERVGLGRCTDQAFQKLKKTLKTWFPIPTN